MESARAAARGKRQVRNKDVAARFQRANCFVDRLSIPRPHLANAICSAGLLAADMANFKAGHRSRFSWSPVAKEYKPKT
jgi:hypothetical protein